MAVTPVDYFSTLWTDNQIQIFDLAWGESQDLNHRQISRTLCKAVDLLVKKKWEELQANPALGAFGFREACSRIYKKFSVNGKYPEGFNYLSLFRALNREWGLVRVNIPKSQLNVTRAFQNELQTFLHNQLYDESLMSMWDRISLKLRYVVSHEPSNAASLRNYLSLLPVQTVLSSLTCMNFSELGIRFIPFEITYFSDMKGLKFSHNAIDVLPDFIGDLKNLRFLDLEDNDLQELPDDFPNWTYLEKVNLKDNPLNARGLEQYAAWKKNKAILLTVQAPRKFWF